MTCVKIALEIASFSFQLAGAVLLIIWSLGSCDKKIKTLCLDQSNGPLRGNIDNTITIDKDTLQSNAKTVYKNIFAFFDIAIGYICAIFTENSEIKKIYIFVIVIIATLILIFLENCITNIIAHRKYPQDIKISQNDISIKKNQLILQMEEIDE